MKREEILEKINVPVKEFKKRRVILSTDIRNEADDPFSIIHHLLSPGEEVEGIIATHNEFFNALIEKMAAIGKLDELMAAMGMNQSENEADKGGTPGRGESMEANYQEGRKLLEAAEIEDVPLLRGAKTELPDDDSIPESKGADFIVRAALSGDSRPLYVCLLGAATDMAIALLKKPEIAEHIIVVWNGGCAYPGGGREFNLMQDVKAVNVIMESGAEVWQIPNTVYGTFEFGRSELSQHIRPCGALGRYLYEEMTEFYMQSAMASVDFPSAESWCLGDNATNAVFLQNPSRVTWHMEDAPFVESDFSYGKRENAKKIRVYDSLDVRLTLSDLYAKIALAYGNGIYGI